MEWTNLIKVYQECKSCCIFFRRKPSKERRSSFYVAQSNVSPSPGIMLRHFSAEAVRNGKHYNAICSIYNAVVLKINDGEKANLLM